MSEGLGISWRDERLPLWTVRDVPCRASLHQIGRIGPDVLADVQQRRVCVLVGREVERASGGVMVCLDEVLGIGSGIGREKKEEGQREGIEKKPE